MGMFRKKPVLVEAHRFTLEAKDRIFTWVTCFHYVDWKDGEPTMIIRTLEGNMMAQLGDWIIKGVNGEFYPCKPDIFEKSYELVWDTTVGVA